jgi:hypothetical protein
MAARLLSPGRAVLEKILDIAFIPLIGLILLARLQDFPATTIMIVVVGVIYTTRNVLTEEGSFRDIGFNWVDISTLVVLTTEIINYFASTYRLNTLSSLVDVSFLFLLYWTLRVNLKHEYQIIALLVVLTIFGAYFSAKVIYAFLPQYQYMNYLRFTDLSDFRERINLLTPAGMAVAEWITVFLVFLPGPILLLIRYKHIRYRHRFPIMLLPIVCFVLLVLIAIAISFSRALYISAFSFFFIASGLCFYYRLFSLRQLLIFNGIVAVTFLVIVAFGPIAKPVITTMSIVRTPSQIRSLQGRFSTWTTALEMVRSHQLLWNRFLQLSNATSVASSTKCGLRGYSLQLFFADSDRKRSAWALRIQSSTFQLPQNIPSESSLQYGKRLRPERKATFCGCVRVRDNSRPEPLFNID